MTSATPVSSVANPGLDADLRHGHIVIIAARWLLVVAGLGFLLYRPLSTAELGGGIVGVLTIAVANFWLHTRVLTRQPIEPQWAYWASAADLAVVSFLVLVQGSPASKAFVFYYPAILAYSLVFPAQVTGLLTSGVLSFVLIAGINDGLDERILAGRLLTLAAVSLIGWRYREVEAQRRARRAELSIIAPAESPAAEAKEDVYYGQIVCIVARWFVIAGALFLTLWHAPNVDHIQRNILPLVLVIAANFYLHGRYVMGLPANALLLALASALDAAVVTVVLMAGTPEFYVFYYPVVLAFALVFVRGLTLAFTSLVAAAYAVVFVLIAPGLALNGDEENLAIRLVTLLGTALLGTLYWRLERARRRGEAVIERLRTPGLPSRARPEVS